MDRYPNISDHGLIGDLQTAALVSTDGVLDWFCCPRFDSPSVFASLLDAERGGFYRIAPDRDDYVSRQLTFEKMFTYANHLGLFSEEIDATGGQLGNFPQAFSHLSLISAAVNLDRQLDHGPGAV
jgi:GH15 family glucan-1,4-alpha-glucosidase